MTVFVSAIPTANFLQWIWMNSKMVSGVPSPGRPAVGEKTTCLIEKETKLIYSHYFFVGAVCNSDFHNLAYTYMISFA